MGPEGSSKGDERPNPKGGPGSSSSLGAASSAATPSASATLTDPYTTGAANADSSTTEGTGTRPGTPLSSKRLWASLWAIAALVVSAIGFWFAHTQPATLPMWEPPAGFWAEFWQPREVNRWQRSQAVITQMSLRSVAFSPDGKTALATGGVGTLLKSVDAGQSWQTMVSGSKEDLRSVAFSPDSKTALAAGLNGTLLKSADAGQSWQSVASGSNVNLWSVAFSPDGKTALAAGDGGTLVKSADAGQSWQTVVSGSKEILWSVAFSSDGKTALLAGTAGTLLKSADAGQSWQSVVSGSKEDLRSAAFSPDGKTALAAGWSGTLLKSADAGQSWQSVVSGSKEILWSVAFSPDGRTALAAGSRGTLLKSADAGQSWQTVVSGSKEDLWSAAFSPNGKIALAAGSRGTLLKSADAGQSWQTVVSGSKDWLTSVAFSPDGKTALTAGDAGRLLISADAGQSWQGVVSGSKEDLLSVAFSPDGRAALAAGDGGTLLKSTDAGQSWQSVVSGSKEFLFSVAFSPVGKAALAAGRAGTMLNSADAGQSWQAVVSGSKEFLFSVAFSPDGKTALAAGGVGTLLKSTDAGQSWQTMVSGSKESLSSVAFSADGKTVLAAGSVGTLLKSADAGQSWQTVVSGSTDWLTSGAFNPDGKSALAAGWSGTLLKSVDNGQSWQAVVSGSNEHLSSVAFSPVGKTALAAGSAGTLLKSTDAGQTWQAAGLYSKSPGPWFTALLAGLAILCFLVYRRLMAPGKTLLGRLGILFNAVTDKPIENASEDKLAFTPVVEALSAFLRHTATRPSLSIAINAAWGMGKSSFMNMLAGSLKKRGAKPVHFNGWHHQHEEVLLAPLLQAIVNQAIPGWALWAGWRFRALLWWERSRRWDWAFWLGSLAPLSVPAYLLWLALRTWHVQSVPPLGLIDEAVRDVHKLVTMLTSGQWQASVKNGSLSEVAAAALMAVTSDLVNALIVLGVVLLVVSWVMLFSYTLRPFPASPAILVASLDKRFNLSKAEAQTDFRQRFRRHFGQVARALQPKTMVIFIDDLDRCKPEKAAELLEAANYLSDAGPCFIILGISREIVEAQVANAHKVVAEEQAAMQRVRNGEVLTKDAKEVRGDADRLAYAQKYLRKLVQLDVALPRLDAQRAIQLLLDKLGAGDAQTSAQAQKEPWISPRLRGILLLCLMLMGGGGLVGWRTFDTLKVIEASRLVEVDRLLVHTAGLRKEVEAARVYANWLGDMATSKTAVAVSPPASAASAASAAKAITPPNTASASPLLYKAKADMMQGVLRDLEAGLAALEREAREGQGKTFKKLKEKAFQPSETVYNSYTQAPQIDGRNWPDIVAGLQAPAGGASSPASATKAIAAVGDPNGARARETTAPTRATAATENPFWDPNMGLFIAAMVTLLLAIFRAKDNYEVQPTPEYEAAVAEWQKVLLFNRDTASPRELKRFMNLSRYAVARLQTVSGSTTVDEKVPAKLPITETRIVELTAKWLALAGKLKQGAMRQVLGKDGAKPDEIRLFLEIVGDMGDGTPEAASSEATRVAGKNADLEPSDREEVV